MNSLIKEVIGLDEGTGLGLSISRSLIEKQGGKLSLAHESNPTMFVINIPVVKAPAVAKKKAG